MGPKFFKCPSGKSLNLPCSVGCTEPVLVKIRYRDIQVSYFMMILSDPLQAHHIMVRSVEWLFLWIKLFPIIVDEPNVKLTARNVDNHPILPQRI